MTLYLLGFSISGTMLSPPQKIGEETHCYLDNFNLTTSPKSHTLGLVGRAFSSDPSPIIDYACHSLLP